MMEEGGIWDFEFRNADLGLRCSSPTVREGFALTIQALPYGRATAPDKNPQSEIPNPKFPSLLTLPVSRR